MAHAKARRLEENINDEPTLRAFAPSRENNEFGNLPMDWKIQSLGEVCNIRSGKKDVNEGNPAGKYPFFTCSKDVHYSDSYSFDTEAILVAGNGVVGETKYFRGKFEAYQRTYVLDQFTVFAPYLFLFLKGTLVAALNKHVAGSTMPYIRKGALENIEIPLPLLFEQHQIAAVLGVVQRAIEQQQRLLALTAELKKTLLHQLFTQGLRGEPQKQTEIGPVPESWEVVMFEDFALLQRGFDLSKSEFRQGPYPVVGATKTIGFHDKYNVKGPGVTVVRSGSSAGMPQFVPNNFWAHNVVLFVKNFHDHNPKFVYYKIQHLDLTKYREGVAVPTLNRNSFRLIPVAVPLRDEQDEFVRILDAVEAQESIHLRKQAALSDLFRTLLHQLMTAQIRVHDLDLPELEIAGAGL